MTDETFGRSYAGQWLDDPDARYFERGNIADYVRPVMHKQPHFTCG